jgi:MIP family channel proteins
MNKLMLKKYVAEFVGTFALVFIGCGTESMVGITRGYAGILLINMAFGLIIGAMIYILGNISGGIFNPALTFGFALTRRFPWRYVLPYWLFQVAGAVFASFLLYLIIRPEATNTHFGATLPRAGSGNSFVLEVVLTFFLMLSNMATATDRRVNRAATGITVGFIILVDGLFGMTLSGAGMNPARSLGPALFAGGQALSSIWIYILAPLVGALIAAPLYELIRGDPKEARPVVLDIPPT